MGFAIELFHDDVNLQDAQCAICQDIWRTPVTLTGCSHHFCSKCLETWLVENEDCPICRRPGRLEPPEPDTLQMFNRLPLKCQNFELGCVERIHMPYWMAHHEICEYRLTQCPKNCGTLIPVMAMPRHAYLCTFGCDPILLNLLCFMCKGKYQSGIIPTHCDYINFARELWDNGSSIYTRPCMPNLQLAMHQ